MFEKVLLTQFAVPDITPLAYRSNAHLAPGYLVGYARKQLPFTQFVITPRVYTDVLNESAFVEYAVATKPDLLCFSLYLWNVEKSLRVASVLQQRLPGVRILFGGPEVTPDNQLLLSSDAFAAGAAGIVGEGEVPFCEYLQGKPSGEIAGWLSASAYNDWKALRTTYCRETNPYLAGLIETRPDTTMFFETVRGCPFSCRFCYYNKVYDRVVSVGRNHIQALFERARGSHFEELFILDPSFNMQPDFDGLLDTLLSANHDRRFKIATELRADYLTDTQIEKLAQLNVVEVEVGLQSTQPDALAAVGRKDTTVQTIAKTQKLMTAGIRCKVDLIAGLPGDTLAGFKRSVDEVYRTGIHHGIQVFRLSVLPGTVFAVEKERFGISAQPRPPYYLESTPSFSNLDIRTALAYAEDKFEVSLHRVPPYLLATDFTGASTKYDAIFEAEQRIIHKLWVRSTKVTSAQLLPHRHSLGENLVVHFEITDATAQQKGIVELLQWMGDTLVHNFFQFILDFRCDVDMSLIRTVAGCKPPGDHEGYLARDAAANLNRELSLSSALAVIVPVAFRTTDAYAELKEQCDVFLHISEYDPSFIDDAYDDHNFYFSGAAQQSAFEKLAARDRLDDFTLFESFAIERKKAEWSERIYAPTTAQLML